MRKCQVYYEILLWIFCASLVTITGKGGGVVGKVSSERIQRFRTELGYTQEDLAELCGVDASCISRWETGKWSPSAANTLLLAKALKVSIEDLYDDGKTTIEDVATKQAVAEFRELKPKERGLVLTLIRELKKLRGGD